jgi:CBS domain-containing protein
MVFEAIKLMAEKDVGALLVMDAGTLVGMITERHYAREIALKGRTSPQTPVHSVMKTEVVCTFPTQTIDECMRLMTECRERHMPVLEGKDVIGIISIGDVVKGIIDEQQCTIGHLESYLHGEHTALHG